MLVTIGLVMSILAAGCQTPVRLMPTPVAFSAGDVDPFGGVEAKVARTDVPVLYATNRLPLVEWPEPLFTALPGAQLRVGIAHVRIGDDPLDWETLHRLSTSDDIEQRPIVRFDWLEPKGTLPDTGAPRAHSDAEAPAFFRLVNHALALSPGREIVVYVHGANSPVPRAVAQAAQFQHFATRRVVVVSFMWPSAGSILRYLTDVGSAAASVEPLAQLLLALAENTHASAISVLAYSAGAKIASSAVARLADSHGASPAAREKLRLHNLYFAAPDVDTRLFVDQIRNYIDLVGRVTVAFNQRDSALRVSQLVHRASRAGRPDSDELDPRQRAFMIDASRRLGFDLVEVDPDAIPGLARRSHAFWYEHPWVSSDVIALLLFDATPAERGLEERIGEQGARFWTFPPDFDQRIAGLFVRLRGEDGRTSTGDRPAAAPKAAPPKDGR